MGFCVQILAGGSLNQELRSVDDKTRLKIVVRQRTRDEKEVTSWKVGLNSERASG